MISSTLYDYWTMKLYVCSEFSLSGHFQPHSYLFTVLASLPQLFVFFSFFSHPYRSTTLIDRKVGPSAAPARTSTIELLRTLFPTRFKAAHLLSSTFQHIPHPKPSWTKKTTMLWMEHILNPQTSQLMWPKNGLMKARKKTSMEVCMVSFKDSATLNLLPWRIGLIAAIHQPRQRCY